MSVETAREFLKLLNDDPPMQSQLLVYQPQTAENIVAFAGNKGFLFTEDDLRAALKAFPDSVVKL